MSRIWLPGGAGGADLDVITAGAGDVLSGKVIVDKEGEPLTGTLALTGTAADSHVLSGQTYYNTDAKTKRTGNMTNRGAVSQALNAGGSYTIPAGYHNGAGKVTANSLAGQTSADAAAGHILSGKTAWVNGSKVTGNMANRGAVSQALNAGGSYTIPAGYHNGAGKVTANSLASQTSANAAAGHILSGKTAWVNGSKVTGDIASLAAQTVTPGASAKTVTCSGKYMTGNITVSAVSNLTAANIKKGVTVGGVVGTYEGYASSPLYLFRNGTWSNLQTTGVTTTHGANDADVKDGVLRVYTSLSGDKMGFARLNQTFNLTNYKYIKAKIENGSFYGRIGIGTATNITALASLTKYSGETTSGVAILDISSVSGNYYIYLTAQHKTSGNTAVLGGAVLYEELFLANT